MSHELSLADIAAVNGGGMNGEMWNNPFIYLVWLAVLGGGGLFGNRFGGDPGVQGAITRSDLFEGFNNQDVNGQLRGITSGICDGFYAVNTGMLNGFTGVQRDLTAGFGAVSAGLSENRFAAQNCCLTSQAA